MVDRLLTSDKIRNLQLKTELNFNFIQVLLVCDLNNNFS